MTHASLHKLHRRVTRAQLERLLGGVWEQDETDPTRRRNGRWETWKAPSKLVQERTDCFVRNLRSGATRSGKNWHTLAQALKVAL